MPKYLPHGTTVQFAGSAVGGLVAVSIPDRTKGEAETTDSGSTFDRAYVPGLREGGTVELTMRHMPGDVGQEALQTNYAANNTTQTVIITLPDAATSAGGSRTYTFTGFVTAPPQGELALIDDEAAELTCTIKVAGAVAIAG